ncbi:unnamed protein product [marine sediment metagenome]|uniref:Uncharacterized protein n=1 Tax=marine sediment metagenome TaxID=412755 RepID=X1A3K9_9ZZZZ
MKAMSREETAIYIKNRVDNGRRVVVTRYGDGEYFLMIGDRNAGKEPHRVVGPLLRQSVKKKGQLVCVPPINDVVYRQKNNIFVKTVNYIQKTGEQELYGTGAWARWDLDNNNEIFYKFFKGKVLLVSSLSAQAKNIFSHFETYSMPPNRASSKYEESLNDISIIAKEFDNILFACGPIGKVIIPDIVNITNANIIDIGHILNVLLKHGPQSSWGRLNAKRGKVDKMIAGILEKI